jgi:hypothetical protein
VSLGGGTRLKPVSRKCAFIDNSREAGFETERWLSSNIRRYDWTRITQLPELESVSAIGPLHFQQGGHTDALRAIFISIPQTVIAFLLEAAS